MGEVARFDVNNYAYAESLSTAVRTIENTGKHFAKKRVSVAVIRRQVPGTKNFRFSDGNF